MDIRLIENACKGKSYSQGGLNVTQIKNLLASVGLPSTGLRADLLKILCSNMHKFNPDYIEVKSPMRQLNQPTISGETTIRKNSTVSDLSYLMNDYQKYGYQNIEQTIIKGYKDPIPDYITEYVTKPTKRIVTTTIPAGTKLYHGYWSSEPPIDYEAKSNLFLGLYPLVSILINLETLSNYDYEISPDAIPYLLTFEVTRPLTALMVQSADIYILQKDKMAHKFVDIPHDVVVGTTRGLYYSDRHEDKCHSDFVFELYTVTDYHDYLKLVDVAFVDIDKLLSTCDISLLDVIIPT